MPLRDRRRRRRLALGTVRTQVRTTRFSAGILTEDLKATQRCPGGKNTPKRRFAIFQTVLPFVFIHVDSSAFHQNPPIAVTHTRHLSKKQIICTNDIQSKYWPIYTNFFEDSTSLPEWHIPLYRHILTVFSPLSAIIPMDSLRSRSKWIICAFRLLYTHARSTERKISSWNALSSASVRS